MPGPPCNNVFTLAILYKPVIIFFSSFCLYNTQSRRVQRELASLSFLFSPPSTLTLFSPPSSLAGCWLLCCWWELEGDNNIVFCLPPVPPQLLHLLLEVGVGGGEAWRGVAWRGEAWRGVAWRGETVMASSRLIIRNLPPSVDDARLRQHFSSAGPWKLTDARVQRSTGGASRGFGFLGFESPQEAQKALKHFGGTFLDSNRVSVAYADPIKPRGSKGKDSDRDGGAQVGAHTKHGAALETKRNAEKEDFIAASKKRSEARFWANDEGEMQVESGGAVAAAQAGDKDLEWLHKKAQGKAALEESQDQSRMEATSAGANLEGKGNAADRLFIRNLPFTATEEDIRATFESHGNVTEVRFDFLGNKPKLLQSAGRPVTLPPPISRFMFRARKVGTARGSLS
jgi:hypothetical protein